MLSVWTIHVLYVLAIMLVLLVWGATGVSP